jgi:predicted phage-related endonuclease
MDQNTKDILEIVNFIKDRMLTKDDVRVIVREELREVRSDVKAIRTELDELIEKVDNISGYRKEIDHALERIAEIERHLGINKKISA